MYHKEYFLLGGCMNWTLSTRPAFMWIAESTRNGKRLGDIISTRFLNNLAKQAVEVISPYGLKSGQCWQ
jgi:hypothetical protein